MGASTYITLSEVEAVTEDLCTLMEHIVIRELSYHANGQKAYYKLQHMLEEAEELKKLLEEE